MLLLTHNYSACIAFTPITMQFRDDMDSAMPLKAGNDHLTTNLKIVPIYVFAEFLGSFMTMALSIGTLFTVGIKMWQFDNEVADSSRILCISLSNGFVFTAILYIMRNITSLKVYDTWWCLQQRKKNITMHYPVGHCNPAITLTVCLVQDLSPKLAVYYLIAQIAGYIAGGHTIVLMFSQIETISFEPLYKEASVFQATFLAAICTFILCFGLIMLLVENHIGHTQPSAVANIQQLLAHTSPLVLGFTVRFYHLFPIFFSYEM